MSNPPPIVNDSIPIYQLVLRDVRERAEHGKKQYGTYLQADNGRNALQDAYEEALDLVVYLKQALQEQMPKPEPILGVFYELESVCQYMDKKYGVSPNAIRKLVYSVTNYSMLAGELPAYVFVYDGVCSDFWPLLLKEFGVEKSVAFYLNEYEA